MKKAIDDLLASFKSIYEVFLDIPNALRILNPKEVLENYMTILYEPFDEAIKGSIASLNQATDTKKFLARIYGEIEIPAEDGTTAPIIPQAQAVAATQARILGVCETNADNEVDPECPAAATQVNKTVMANMVAMQATRSQNYIAAMETFRRRLILGDEMSGGCTDIKEDEECQTVAGFMGRSLNLRQDTMVNSAILYTNLLVDMLHLEAIAFDSAVRNSMEVSNRGSTLIVSPQ